MYHYVEDKEFLSSLRQLCGKIMQDLCHNLNEDHDISAISYLVGSGAKNLIVQNNVQPIDLDYNLEIVQCADFIKGEALKECVRKSFNKALNAHHWRDCEDSTSSLTTKKMQFIKGNQTKFSIDVCIVRRDGNDALYRLIHEKTGFYSGDRYYWNRAPYSAGLRKKADAIKRQGKWLLVREQYLNIKNAYLRKNDYNHPSFICYIEAVNNVYNALSN